VSLASRIRSKLCAAPADSKPGRREAWSHEQGSNAAERGDENAFVVIVHMRGRLSGRCCASEDTGRDTGEGRRRTPTVCAQGARV